MSLSISSSKRSVSVYAAAFAAMLVICGGASEWLVRTQVAPIDTMTQHVKDFRTVTTDHVAFGDSRLSRGFAAKAPFHNFAYPSESLDQILWKIDSYVARNGAPKQIILQADPHMFAAYRFEKGMGDYETSLGGTSKWYDLMILEHHHKPQVRRYWERYVLSGGNLSSTINRSETGTLLSPGDFSEKTPEQKVRLADFRTNIHKPVSHFAGTDQAKKYRDTVARLSAAGTKICLIRTPTSPAYKASMERLPDADKANIAAVNAWFEMLSAINNVTYVDLVTLTNDASEFRDADHMNEKGALRYAETFTDACFATQQDKTLGTDRVG